DGNSPFKGGVLDLTTDTIGESSLTLIGDHNDDSAFMDILDRSAVTPLITFKLDARADFGLGSELVVRDEDRTPVVVLRASMIPNYSRP
ncbi:MAG: hypothetical protein ABFS46_20830, partial [Myxococcota bacterium]